MNNKIDLEIRILDGILKLLNAICSANPQAPNQPSLNTVNNLNSLSSSNASNITFSNASLMITNLDVGTTDDVNKCAQIGAEIAAALMSNKMPSEQQSQQINTNNINEAEFNHIFQILSACKCLYVSHRKISIYLHNLQELEKRTSGKKKHLSSSDILKLTTDLKDEDENSVPKSATIGPLIKKNTNKPFSKINFNSSVKKSEAPVVKLQVDVLSIETMKLMLKDIRFPLIWKYSDHIKAIKNSGIFLVTKNRTELKLINFIIKENINQKFATFAIIHLGNMIYDTR